MSERLNMFPTPVLKAHPPEAEALNEALLKVIFAERDRNPGLDRSNFGGWHSDIDMIRWAGKPAEQLAEFAVQEASQHMADVSPLGKRQFRWGIDMWANINGPGNANQLHCHPGAYWSAVYYPDPGGAEEADNGGALVLEDPRYPTAYQTVTDLVLRDAEMKPMYSQVAIQPRAGLLVMFPSWLRHSVQPHHGDRERVSVAINLMLVDAMPENMPPKVS